MSTKAKSKKGKKIITLVSVLLIVVIAGALTIPGIVSARNNKTAAQTSVATRTVTVGTQDITQAVSGSGEIVTGDQETLEADTDKTVDTVSVVTGQAVKKGAVILTYTDGTEMTSPINGVIGTITIPDSTGNSMQNAVVSDSIVIMSTDNLVTDLSIDETDLQNIKVGQKAEVTINALPDTKYTGKVTSIGQTGTYSNGSSKFQITIKLDKLDNVKIGMSAAVEIVVKSVTDAVAVPIEAVKGSGDNASVMLVNSDGTASPTSVKLGLANKAYVQIVSGLSEGEKIQYTVQTSSSSGNLGGFGGLGSGGMFGNGGMQGRSDNGTGGGYRTSGGGNTTGPNN
ncbi:MAG: efflux RND transporter periplasmic adaptor subunit [Ruminiclostridium sp.]